MARVPIWKDTYYNVPSSASPYTYSVKLKTGRQIIINGTATDEIITVFNGKAYVRPGDEFIRININHIAQNYLSSDLPDLRDITATTQYTNTEACREFYICNENGNTAATYNFLLDYSYEDIDLSVNQDLSVVVNGHGAPGMLYLSTAFVASSLTVVTTLSINASSSFTETYCGDYAVYFLSRSGGWSSFLIEGQTVRTDKYTRYQMMRSFDNTTLDWQKQTYTNQINDTYKLNTGWLNDDESSVLAEHLFSSNKVYLHNLKTNEVFPVVITDSNATYKTYSNQGRRLVNYAINVEASQTKNIIG